MTAPDTCPDCHAGDRMCGACVTEWNRLAEASARATQAAASCTCQHCGGATRDSFGAVFAGYLPDACAICLQEIAEEAAATCDCAGCQMDRDEAEEYGDTFEAVAIECAHCGREWLRHTLSADEEASVAQWGPCPSDDCPGRKGATA